jgi:hypothetical protein
MQTADFFRARLDGMIDLKHPLAVLVTRLPWAQLEAELGSCQQRFETDTVFHNQRNETDTPAPIVSCALPVWGSLCREGVARP